MLSEIRTLPDDAKEKCSEQSLHILMALMSDTHPVESWLYAITMDNDIMDQHNDFQRGRVAGVPSVYPATIEAKVQVEQRAVDKALKTRGLRSSCTLITGGRVIIRSHDAIKRWKKGDEATVVDHCATHARLRLSTDKVVRVSPISMDIEGIGKVTLFPLLDAYARTVRLAQSQEKSVWPIILTKTFIDGKLTFDHAQAVVALTRSTLPPPILTPPGKIKSVKDVLSSLMFADAKCVNFMANLAVCWDRIH